MNSCIAIFKHYNTKEHYSDFVYGILQQPVDHTKKFDLPPCYQYYAHPGGTGRITHEIVEIHQMNTNILVKIYYISEHEIGELTFPCTSTRKHMHRRYRRHRKIRETYIKNYDNVSHPWHWFCEFHNIFYKI